MTIQTPATSENTVDIYVWTDLVCPYCLIGEKVINDAIAGLDARIVWKPFELRPAPTPTLEPEGDYLQTAWAQGVLPTAQRHGIKMLLPSASPQPHTRTAFIGMQYADDHGRGSAYVERVLSAFFQEDRNFGDLDVLADLAEEVGLDRTGFLEALKNPAYARRHDEALVQARQVGIRAVPSLLIGDRFFSGVADAGQIRDAVSASTGNLL